jgi:hypothetical protein
MKNDAETSRTYVLEVTEKDCPEVTKESPQSDRKMETPLDKQTFVRII